jgi:hypothetical protein
MMACGRKGIGSEVRDEGARKERGGEKENNSDKENK